MRLRNQIIEEGKMKDNHPGQGEPREEVWERSWGRCQGLQPLHLLILVEE